MITDSRRFDVAFALIVTLMQYIHFSWVTFEERDYEVTLKTGGLYTRGSQNEGIIYKGESYLSTDSDLY